jgi:hypothetical protein
MANCTDCGAEVLVGVLAEGETIPLERWTASDGERYRIVAFGDPHHTVEKVTTPFTDGHPDHRLDCPAHYNGLKGVHTY